MRHGFCRARARGPRRLRHELDYIDGDAAALRWAMGGLLASYRARLAQWRCLSARASFRYVATSGALLLMIGFALAGHASGQPGPLRPHFDETACDLPGVSPEIGPRLRCGTVSVPRNYDNPAGGQFKLAVVVVRSAQQPALPEPVVYINGGPGSPLTVYADHQARTPTPQAAMSSSSTNGEPADRSRTSARTSTARSSMPPSPSQRTRQTMLWPSAWRLFVVPR